MVPYLSASREYFENRPRPLGSEMSDLDVMDFIHATYRTFHRSILLGICYEESQYTHCGMLYVENNDVPPLKGKIKPKFYFIERQWKKVTSYTVIDRSLLGESFVSAQEVNPKILNGTWGGLTQESYKANLQNDTIYLPIWYDPVEITDVENTVHSDDTIYMNQDKEFNCAMFYKHGRAYEDDIVAQYMNTLRNTYLQTSKDEGYGYVTPLETLNSYLL